MYASFYNLQKEPFHITPDPEFLFLSPSHKQALGSIIYGVEQRKGFIAISGEVGVGKTTILRSYLESVDKKDLKIIYIFNPNLPFKGLLENIFRELELDAPTDSVFQMVDALHHRLIEEYEHGHNIILIIDEAQNMPVKTLEELRMLSNLETSKDKLLQILLIGQPELEELLNRNELRQLKQRIAIYSTIAPLTRAESLSYIQSRLKKVSLKNEPVFTTGALKAIVEHARGIPRRINILCDNALITGFGYQSKPVGAKIVREVIADLRQELRRPFFLRWKVILPTLIAVAGSVLWGLRYMDLPFSTGQRTEPAAISSTQSNGNPAEPSKMKRSTELPKLVKPIDKSMIESSAGYPKLASPNVATGRADEEAIPGASASKSDQQSFINTDNQKQEFIEKKTEATNPVLVDQPASTVGEHDSSARNSEMNRKAEFPEKVSATSAPKTESIRDAGSPEVPRDNRGLEALPESKLPPTAQVDTSSNSRLVHRVKRGENLTDIAAEVYGVSSERVIASNLLGPVLQTNPQIRDANRIQVGENIVFPNISTLEERLTN